MTEAEENELKEKLSQIKWPIEYGNIKIQIREGKPTLVYVEKTIKLD